MCASVRVTRLVVDLFINMHDAHGDEQHNRCNLHEELQANIKRKRETDQRIIWEDYFMSIAFLAASRSPCQRLQVGCVLVRDNRVVATGYNGFTSGAPHVSRVHNGHEQMTVHAEQNAVADCAKRGVSVDGCTAFVTHSPCVNCAKLLITAGIKKIMYKFDYGDDAIEQEIKKELYVGASVKVENFDIGCVLREA